MSDVQLTERLASLARELGADLFGVAPVERYVEAGAPVHMRPDALLPGATCAVVIAIHHPDAAIELGGEPDPQTQGPYAIQSRMNEKLEHIMFRLGDLLERERHRVIGLAATNIWRFRGRPEEDNPFLPDLSNIHSAWAAGLGEIGWSGLLLSPEFGPRQRFCCLVTDAPLEPSPIYAGESLCDRCHTCVKNCPTQAFEKEVTGEVVLSAGGSTVRYCEKSKWRCSWAEHFGLDLDLPKPDVITEEVLLEQLAQHGVRGGEMGSCLRFCMAAPRRYFDTQYTRAPRRKRDEPDPERVDEVARAAWELAFRAGVRPYATATKERLSDSLDITELLPDANSAIVFAMPYPPEAGSIASASAAAWADFVELDIARLLESNGYSALPRSGVDKTRVLEAASCEAQSAALGCVLTSARLPGVRTELKDTLAQCWCDAEMTGVLEQTLRRAGAHLVGVADADVLQELVPSLREAFDDGPLREHVRDDGPTHGARKPVIEAQEPPIIRGPRDYLPTAKAVLVLGVHHPFANLDRAGEPPASSVGPYAYAAYQTVRELEYLAWMAAGTLHDWGYGAVVVSDLSGTGSQVMTPRGLQPDARSSRFAAAAAGLATIGWHGAPITPEFGVTQRFISIVTDALLHASEARELTDPCDGCDRACVEACPVGAIAGDRAMETTAASLGKLDGLRCDWAKKYAFVGDEGPALMGQTTDIAPPEGPITAEQIAAALEQKDPVQGHWTCVVERCLQACHRCVGEGAR